MQWAKEKGGQAVREWVEHDRPEQCGDSFSQGVVKSYGYAVSCEDVRHQARPDANQRSKPRGEQNETMQHVGGKR